MVISPPISVVPPVFVVRLLAVTVLPNLVIPVLLTAKSPNAAIPPTIPSKLTLPVPESTVRFLFPADVPFKVLLKLILLLVELKVLALFPVNVTPPVNC